MVTPFSKEEIEARKARINDVAKLANARFELDPAKMKSVLPGLHPSDPNYEGPIYEDVDHHTLANEAMKDEIKRPDHYACYPIEPITFIMMNDLPFCAGNVVKYVCRAGRKSKDPRDDIRKAMRYCEMWIEMLDREEAGTDGDVIGRPL